MSSANQSYTNQLDSYLKQTSQNSKKSLNGSINESIRTAKSMEGKNNMNNHAESQKQKRHSSNQQQMRKPDENNGNLLNQMNNNNGNQNKNNTMAWIHNISTYNSQENPNKGLQSFFSEQQPSFCNNTQQQSEFNQKGNQFTQSQRRLNTKQNDQGGDFLTQPFDYQQMVTEEEDQQPSYYNNNLNKNDVGTKQNAIHNQKRFSSNVNIKVDTFGNEQNNFKDVNESSIQQNRTDIVNQDVLVKSILNQLMTIAMQQNQTSQNIQSSHLNNNNSNNNMINNTHLYNNNNTTIHSRQQSQQTPFELSLNQKHFPFDQQQTNFLSQSKQNLHSNNDFIQNNNHFSNTSSKQQNGFGDAPANLLIGTQSTKNQNLYNLDEFKPKSTLKILSPTAGALLPHNSSSSLIGNQLTSPSTAASYNIENYLPQKKFLKTQSDEIDSTLIQEISNTTLLTVGDKKNVNIQELAQILISEFKNQYKSSNVLNLNLDEDQIKRQKREKLSYVTLPSLDLYLKNPTKMISDSETQTTNDFQFENLNAHKFNQEYKNRSGKSSFEMGSNQSNSMIYQINSQQNLQQFHQQINNTNKGNIMGQSMISRRSSLQNQNTLQQHPGFEYELESELLSEEIHFNHPHSQNNIQTHPYLLPSLTTNHTQQNQMYNYKKGSMTTEQISIPTMSSPNIGKVSNNFTPNNLQQVSQKFDFKKKTNNNYDRQLLSSPPQEELSQKLTSQQSQNKLSSTKYSKPPQHNLNQHAQQGQYLRNIQGNVSGKLNNNNNNNKKDIQDRDDDGQIGYLQNSQMSSLEIKQREKLFEIEQQQKQLEEDFLQKQNQYYRSQQEELTEDLNQENEQFQNKNIQIQEYLNYHQMQREQNMNNNHAMQQNGHGEYPTMNEDYIYHQQFVASHPTAQPFGQNQYLHHSQNKQIPRHNKNLSESHNQDDNSIDMETIMKLERIPFPNISLSRKDSIVTNSNYANLPSQQINNASSLHNNQENSLIQQSGYLQNSMNNNSQNNSFISLNLVHSKIPKGFTNSQLKARSFSSSSNPNIQNSQITNVNYSQYHHHPNGDFADNGHHLSPQQKSDNKFSKNQSEQTSGPEKKQATFSFNHSDYLYDNHSNRKSEEETNNNLKTKQYDEQISKNGHNQLNTLSENLTTFKTFGQTIKPTSSTIKLSQREALSSTKDEDDNGCMRKQKNIFYASYENPLNSPNQIKQQSDFDRKVVMIQSFFRYCLQYKKQLFDFAKERCMVIKKQKPVLQSNRSKKDSQMFKQNEQEVQQSSELLIDSMFSQSISKQNKSANTKKQNYQQQTPKNDTQKEGSNLPLPSTRRSGSNAQNNNNNVYTTSNNFGDSKMSYDLTVSPTTDRRITSQRGSKKQISPKSVRDYNQQFDNNQHAIQQSRELQNQLLILKQQSNQSTDHYKGSQRIIQEESINRSQLNKSNNNSSFSEKGNLSEIKRETSHNSSKIEYKSNSSGLQKSTYLPSNSISMPFTHISKIQNILDEVFSQ